MDVHHKNDLINEFTHFELKYVSQTLNSKRKKSKTIYIPINEFLTNLNNGWTNTKINIDNGK